MIGTFAVCDEETCSVMQPLPDATTGLVRPIATRDEVISWILVQLPPESGEYRPTLAFHSWTCLARWANRTEGIKNATPRRIVRDNPQA